MEIQIDNVSTVYGGVPLRIDDTCSDNVLTTVNKLHRGKSHRYVMSASM